MTAGAGPKMLACLNCFFKLLDKKLLNCLLLISLIEVIIRDIKFEKGGCSNLFFFLSPHHKIL